MIQLKALLETGVGKVNHEASRLRRNVEGELVTFCLGDTRAQVRKTPLRQHSPELLGAGGGGGWGYLPWRHTQGQVLCFLTASKYSRPQEVFSPGWE